MQSHETWRPIQRMKHNWSTLILLTIFPQNLRRTHNRLTIKIPTRERRNKFFFINTCVQSWNSPGKLPYCKYISLYTMFTFERMTIGVYTRRINDWNSIPKTKHNLSNNSTFVCMPCEVYAFVFHSIQYFYLATGSPLKWQVQVKN